MNHALLATLLLSLLTACGTMVRTAPFRERPDAAAYGSALGPFSGRVVDADTGRPIENAVVWCGWSFATGMGTQTPSQGKTYLTRTSPDGRFQVPQLTDLPSGLSARLDSVSLVVYQRDYVAFRQDWNFSPRELNQDFSQLDSLIELTRWSSELSHAQHLVFLGGDDELRQLASAEAAMAALELSTTDEEMQTPSLAGQPPGEAQPASQDARRLLTTDDVRTVTRYTGLFEGMPLADAGDATDSWHLRAVDRSERYDVALRLWRLPESELEEKYRQIVAALPENKEDNSVGDRSFVVERDELWGMGFMLKAHEAIILVTCGKSQCQSSDQLRDIARRVEAHAMTLPGISDLSRVKEQFDATMNGATTP